jgi:hypothetical protein
MPHPDAVSVPFAVGHPIADDGPERGTAHVHSAAVADLRAAASVTLAFADAADDRRRAAGPDLVVCRLNSDLS